MSDAATSTDRLLNLAGMICNESASVKDFLELDAMLRTDKALRHQYVDYCRMHVALRLELRAYHAAQNACLQSQAKSVILASKEFDITAVETPSTKPFGFLSTTIHSTIGFFSQELPFSLLIAAVLTSLGLWFASMVYVSSPEKITKDSSSFSLPTKTTFDPTLKVVGKITGMDDCKWADPNTETFNGANVLLGRKYALASGLMEITYDTGAKVILQGPVTYEVESNGGYLAVGKLTGKLEKRGESRGERAEGDATLQLAKSRNPEISKSPIANPQSLIPNPFVIHTPTATVTDLGTEFGVDVNEKGITETQVFVGEVNIASSALSEDTKGRSQIVRAGQAMRVDGKKMRLVAIGHSGGDQRRFARAMPTSNRSPMADAYAKLVLSMQPAVYYRMEPPKDEKDDKILFDSAPGGHHGVLHFSNDYVGRPFTSGRFGQSLRFRGRMVGDYAIVPDYPKTQDGRLSVAAWVITNSREGCPMIAANWGGKLLPERLCTGQFHLGLFGDRGLAANVTQRDEKVILACDEGAFPFPTGQWQHVAFTADGTMLRLYRNGIEVASHPCDGIVPRPPMASLAIGCRTANDGIDVDPDSPCYWWGQIDELVVFNRALSLESIQQLYLGIPEPGHSGQSSQRMGSTSKSLMEQK